MTTLRFYKGLNTIGGTVVEIQTEDACCIFDFGLDGATEIDRRVKLRPEAMVRDHLAAGCLPMVTGLYDHAELGNIPLTSYSEAEIKPFVLISHMHIDHMGALGFLSKEVDVFMSEDSLLMYRGLIITEGAFFRPHENVIGAAPMEWVKRGSITFRMIPVDHDVPGACGFEIVTPDGRICYTGDLRLHGFYGGDTLAFASNVRGADVCITEGVTVSFIEDFDAVVPDSSLDPATTEQQALEDISVAASKAQGLVFLNLYNRNIQRLALLHDSMKKAGRQLVLEPETATLLNYFSPKKQLYVYEPLCHRSPCTDMTAISRGEIQGHPDRYALQLSYENLLETLDFEPSNSLYIHSNGVPLGAYDPAYQRLLNFLSQQGIPYQSISCGGHASPAHLKFILEAIAPKCLVPLHCLTPEKICIDGSKQVLPKPGECYILHSGDLLLPQINRRTLFSDLKPN